MSAYHAPLVFAVHSLVLSQVLFGDNSVVVDKKQDHTSRPGMNREPDDDLWSAIADPSRRRVLDLLVTGGEATATDLAGQVPFTRQAVSKHLVALEEAGLVRRRKQGRDVLFRVDDRRLDQATRVMADVAGRWERRLDAIKRLAEADHMEQKSRSRR